MVRHSLMLTRSSRMCNTRSTDSGAILASWRSRQSATGKRLARYLLRSEPRLRSASPPSRSGSLRPLKWNNEVSRQRLPTLSSNLRASRRLEMKKSSLVRSLSLRYCSQQHTGQSFSKRRRRILRCLISKLCSSQSSGKMSYRQLSRPYYRLVSRPTSFPIRFQVKSSAKIRERSLQGTETPISKPHLSERAARYYPSECLPSDLISNPRT